MKIFDLHADLGDDVFRQHRLGNKNILLNHHVDKLSKGEIMGVCMASYFAGEEDWQTMQDEIITLKNELNETSHFHQLLTGSDLLSTQPLALMSVEGMCGIKDDEVNKINWLYHQGIRLASFTWNDENALGTGVRGDISRGLSSAGKNALYRMNQLHMIVDVSHANERTFWDIMNLSKGLVIASHSNARTLCNHPRNLDDEQCLAIAKKGGLIGLNATSIFIDEDKEKQTALTLAKHAVYLKDLVGIDTIACGFDFMDFFDDCDDILCKDLMKASDAQNFVEALRQVGFNETEIERVCYKNVVEKFSAYL